jgi:hypothetical protein
MGFLYETIFFKSGTKYHEVISIASTKNVEKNSFWEEKL